MYPVNVSIGRQGYPSQKWSLAFGSYLSTRCRAKSFLRVTDGKYIYNDNELITCIFFSRGAEGFVNVSHSVIQWLDFLAVLAHHLP